MPSHVNQTLNKRIDCHIRFTKMRDAIRKYYVGAWQVEWLIMRVGRTIRWLLYIHATTVHTYILMYMTNQVWMMYWTGTTWNWADLLLLSQSAKVYRIAC